MSTYTLSDGELVVPGDIVELVDGPADMHLFGDRVTLHRLEVREPDDTLSPDYVPVWHHPFMLSFPADRLRRASTYVCDECDRLIPTGEGEDSPWHDHEYHGRPTSADALRELEAPYVARAEANARTVWGAFTRTLELPAPGQIVSLELSWRRGQLAEVIEAAPDRVKVRCRDGVELTLHEHEFVELMPIEEVRAVLELGEANPAVSWRDIVDKIRAVLAR